MSDHSRLATAFRARLAELGSEIDAIEAARRAPLDADFGEQARELAGQDALGGIEDARLHEADTLRAALARIADGSYGTCSVCGTAIGAGRLAALPAATTCIGCAAG
jgi:RNA polymerase-binding transcription factor DksA